MWCVVYKLDNGWRAMCVASTGYRFGGFRRKRADLIELLESSSALDHAIEHALMSSPEFQNEANI